MRTYVYLSLSLSLYIYIYGHVYFVLHQKRTIHGKVLKLDFVRRGGTIFQGWNLSVVVHGKVYVSSLEMCYNPIGRDDTRRSSVWVLYRNGIYGANIDEIWTNFGQIWRNFVKIWCFLAFLDIYMTSFRQKCIFFEKKMPLRACGHTKKRL